MGSWRPGVETRPIPTRWILEISDANETLWPPIADQLVTMFHAENIAWHEEKSKGYGKRPGPGPSPNLMDSQIACLNFWVGLADCGGEAVLAALRVLFPEAHRIIEPRAGSRVLVEPEWIGLQNYLGEKGSKRRRGEYATSADLLLAFESDANLRVGVLLESKFSESYSGESLRFSKWGTDRVGIYGLEWSRPDSPFSGLALELHELMFDPFDQLLRLHLLARAMERNRELGFDRVLVAWVAPRANEAIWSNVTAPALGSLGGTVPEVWRTLLAAPDSFRVAAYEDLFEVARAAVAAGEWADWQDERYGWSTM